MKNLVCAYVLVLALGGLVSCQRLAKSDSTVAATTPVNLTNPLRIATSYRLVNAKNPNKTLMVATPHFFHNSLLAYRLKGLDGKGQWRYGTNILLPERYGDGIFDGQVKEGLKFYDADLFYGAFKSKNYVNNIVVKSTDNLLEWYLVERETTTRHKGVVVADTDIILDDAPAPGMEVYVETLGKQICVPNHDVFRKEVSEGLVRYDFKIHAVTNVKEAGNLYLVSEFRPMLGFMIKTLSGLPVYEKKTGKLVGFVDSFVQNPQSQEPPTLATLNIISVMSNLVRRTLLPVDGDYPLLEVPDAIDSGWKTRICKSPMAKEIIRSAVRRYRYEREKAILDRRDTATSRKVSIDPRCSGDYIRHILNAEIAKLEGRNLSQPISKMIKYPSVDERIVFRFCGNEYLDEALKDILKGDPTCPSAEQ